MQRHLISALAATLAAAVALPVLAQDLPKRKSGLWEISMETGNGRAQGGRERMMTQCVDQAKDDVFRQMGERLERESKCTRTNVERAGNRLSFDSSCDFGSMKTMSKSVVTGDFNTAYKIEIHSRYEPPMMGRSESTTVMNATWAGACKAGQRPGDVTMAGGATMNVYDMMDAKKK